MSLGRARVLAGFACFGLFWGSWGALLPAIQRQALVSDAGLGAALLMIGLGALVTMRVAGSLVDRYGGVALPVIGVAFAAAAFLPALATSGLVLAAVLLLLGGASGALDVAINAAAVGEEATTGRPLVNQAHACFSASVVTASLGVASLRSMGAGSRVVLGVVFAVIAAVSVVVLRGQSPGAGPVRQREHWSGRLPATLLLLGGLGALAYLLENAWQSWGAVLLESGLGAGPALGSAAPATFAAAAAVGRAAGGMVARRVPGPRLLAAGALVGAAGSALAALAPSPPAALAGIAVAGLGTSVCAPTVISLAGRWAGVAARGAAVSTVTTLSYLGFLLGPAAVGVAASATSLRLALSLVALLAVLLACLAPLSRRALAGDRA